MLFKAFISVALLGAVNALPAVHESRKASHPDGPHGGPPSQPYRAPRGEKRVADFDKLEPTPADAVVSIGKYGLYYQGFVTLQAGVSHEDAPDNVAVYGLHSELEGPYTISADYDGSIYKDFDLSSLYYSCAVVTGDGEATLPTACTIRATGYDGMGNSVVSQEFEYNARRLSSPMEQAQFGVGFSHIKEVRFETSTAGDEMVATIFDDIRYTVYKKSYVEESHQ